jgi:hypothetical protein
MATFKHDPGPEPDDGLPATLADVSRLELALWASAGPVIAGDGTTLTAEGEALYTRWPTWERWSAFYGSIRAELHADRPPAPLPEALHTAIEAGESPEAVLDEIDARAAANDPRRRLLGQVKG